MYICVYIYYIIYNVYVTACASFQGKRCPSCRSVFNTKVFVLA